MDSADEADLAAWIEEGEAAEAAEKGCIVAIAS
jgi:hypothetical protein